jgi:hypothetical protein
MENLARSMLGNVIQCERPAQGQNLATAQLVLKTHSLEKTGFACVVRTGMGFSAQCGLAAVRQLELPEMGQIPATARNASNLRVLIRTISESVMSCMQATLASYMSGPVIARVLGVQGRPNWNAWLAYQTRGVMQRQGHVSVMLCGKMKTAVSMLAPVTPAAIDIPDASVPLIRTASAESPTQPLPPPQIAASETSTGLVSFVTTTAAHVLRYVRAAAMPLTVPHVYETLIEKELCVSAMMAGQGSDVKCMSAHVLQLVRRAMVRQRWNVIPVSHMRRGKSLGTAIVTSSGVRQTVHSIPVLVTLYAIMAVLAHRRQTALDVNPIQSVVACVNERQIGGRLTARCTLVHARWYAKAALDQTTPSALRVSLMPGATLQLAPVNA